MNVLDGDVQAYFHGTLDVIREDYGLRLRRLTERQISHYEKSSDAWHTRALCNAGAILALRTNSTTLDLMANALKGARTTMGLNVEVDGQVIRSFYIPDTSNTQTIVVSKNDESVDVLHVNQNKFALRLFEFSEPKERTVRIYLPQSVELQFVSLTIQDDATVKPIDPPKHNLLCLGDSITQGMDATHPLSTYTTHFARLMNANMLNQGVGGHIFDPDSFDPELPFEAEGITIAYGTNDWNGDKTTDQIKENVQAYLSKIRQRYPQHQTEIAVISPIWRAISREKRAGGTLIEFSQTILEATRAFGGIHAIDGLTLVPHRNDLMPDGTHPNDEGFLYYGSNLHRAIMNTD